MPLRFLPLAALALSSAASAQTADLRAFDDAMARSDYRAAAVVYGRLFDARLPADGKPRADGTLDALAGRLLLTLGRPQTAVAFLRLPADGDASDPVRRALALGDAELLIGNTGAAEAAYGLVRDTPTFGVEARVGQAQAALLSAPERVAALLAPVNAAANWRVPFLLAQAALLQNDLPAARVAAARAAPLATQAPVGDFAPRQLLTLQTAIAAAENNRSGVAAMLGSGRTDTREWKDFARALADAAPRCGQDGITPVDAVVVAAVKPTAAMSGRIMPFWASRPGIAPVFMRNLAPRAWPDAALDAASGRIATIRCQFRKPVPQELDPALSATATVHLRPRFLDILSSGDDALTEAGRIVEQIELKVGRSSPILAIPLLELSQMTAERAAEAGDVRMATAQEQAVRGWKLAQAAGTANVPDYFTPGATPAETFARTLAWLRTAPPAAAYAAARSMGEDRPAAERLQVIDAALTRTPPGADKPQDLLVDRADLLAELKRPEFAAAVRAANLDPRDCKALPVRPQLLDGGLTANDYPQDALLAEVEGFTIAELDIAADGMVRSRQTIVELPPLLFATGLEAVSKRTRYEPGRRNNRQTACLGYRQMITWQAPDDDKAPPPAPPDGPLS